MPIEILFVEDDDDAAYIAQQAIERKMGPDVRIQRVTTINLARNLIPEVDITVVDLHVDDSVGLASLMGLRKTFPDVPMVVYSGSDNERHIAGAQLEGVPFVHKRSGPTALVKTIQSTLGV